MSIFAGARDESAECRSNGCRTGVRAERHAAADGGRKRQCRTPPARHERHERHDRRDTPERLERRFADRRPIRTKEPLAETKTLFCALALGSCILPPAVSATSVIAAEFDGTGFDYAFGSWAGSVSVGPSALTIGTFATERGAGGLLLPGPTDMRFSVNRVASYDPTPPGTVPEPMMPMRVAAELFALTLSRSWRRAR